MEPRPAGSSCSQTASISTGSTRSFAFSGGPASEAAGGSETTSRSFLSRFRVRTEGTCAADRGPGAGGGGFLLAVAGKGDPGPYRRAAKRLGIDGKIKWLGPVEDPERLLGAVDVFVLPTLYDPFSNACLEAMAAGVPVVTTRDNGAAEVVEEAGAGWVIDSAGDIDGLSRSIAASCDPSEREKRGRLAREAASRLSMDRFVEGMVRLIEGLGETGT